MKSVALLAALCIAGSQAVKFMNEELTDMNNCVIYFNSRFWTLKSLQNSKGDYQGDNGGKTYYWNFCQDTVKECDGGESSANFHDSNSCTPLTPKNADINGVTY